MLDMARDRKRRLTTRRVHHLVAAALAIAVIAGCASTSYADSRPWPDETRPAYPDARSAGFDEEGLAAAEAYFRRIGGAAGLLVVRGAVAANWGDTNRRFFDASIRKSYLNALIGIAEADGLVDIESSLAELGIQDIGVLTPAERSAMVRQLLNATSGVYHPATPPTSSAPAHGIWRGSVFCTSEVVGETTRR